MGEKPGRREAARKPLYIEIRIDAELERVWELTQNPLAHPRWDLRFSSIIPVDEDNRGQVRFRYEFRLPLHVIKGTGTSLGSRHRADGQATSVLKFDTTDRLSPIGAGAGYWRYIPTDAGIRFITGYNYQPGMGLLGRGLDSRVIRPALGWATALSFDRLRLWAESDIDPRTSRSRWFMDFGARTVGVLVAAGLLYRAAMKRRPWAAVWGAAAMLASIATPAGASIPRAGRCLRRAPDERSARAPSALAGLREPDQAAATDDQSAERK